MNSPPEAKHQPVQLLHASRPLQLSYAIRLVALVTFTFFCLYSSKPSADLVKLRKQRAKRVLNAAVIIQLPLTSTHFNVLLRFPHSQVTFMG